MDICKYSIEITVICTLNNNKYYSRIWKLWMRETRHKQNILHCLESRVISHLAVPISTSQKPSKFVFKTPVIVFLFQFIAFAYKETKKILKNRGAFTKMRKLITVWDM